MYKKIFDNGDTIVIERAISVETGYVLKLNRKLKDKVLITETGELINSSNLCLEPLIICLKTNGKSYKLIEGFAKTLKVIIDNGGNITSEEIKNDVDFIVKQCKIVLIEKYKYEDFWKEINLSRKELYIEI